MISDHMRWLVIIFQIEKSMASMETSSYKFKIALTFNLELDIFKILNLL
jgi:hypothetical protein